jgi:signal transduction histidine kinase
MLINRRYISVQFNEAELRARNRALSVLLDIGNFLAGSQRPDEVLDGALGKVMEHFGLDAGRVYLMDEDGESLTLAAHRGVEVSGLERIHISEGFTGKAAQTRSFILQDASELEDPVRAAMLLSKGLRVIICVPLIAMQSVVGVLNLAASRPIEFDQGEIDLFAVIGNQIAIAILNARLYGALEDKIKELAAKNDTIKFFVYSALHDLKSPLIGMHGLSRRLHQQYRGTLDERGQSYCDQILKVSGHMDALVERINAYITAKETPLRLEPVDMGEIFATIHDELAGVLTERGITWTVPLALPVIRADRLSMTRVFRNLVDNALKYGGSEFREIGIAYRDDESHHIFSVSDDGVGIKAQDQERIFKAFQRQDSSRGVEGSGLGLAIIRVIAERHNGRVMVESAVPKGVTFHVFIAKDL